MVDFVSVQRQRSPATALDHSGGRLVQRMLDGVFESRNNFFDVRRQLAATLDRRPQRDRRRKNQGAVQANRTEIVVEIRPAAAMKRVARLPNSGPAVFPSARSSDVGATLVRQEHVSTAIEALCVSLQAPTARRQERQVGIVRDHDQDIDVFGIRLGRDNGTQQSNSPNAGKPSDRNNETAQSVEKLLAVALGGGSHHMRFNRAEVSHSTAPELRSTEAARPFVGSSHAVRG